LTSAQIAEQLTAQQQPAKPFTDTGIRKTLQRAREKFIELVVYETNQSLPNSHRDELAQELIDLGFMPFCRREFERRRA
jgi:hypothetical protein